MVYAPWPEPQEITWPKDARYSSAGWPCLPLSAQSGLNGNRIMFDRQLTTISRTSSEVNCAAAKNPASEGSVYSSPERLTPRSKSCCKVSERKIRLPDVTSQGWSCESSPRIAVPPIRSDHVVSPLHLRVSPPRGVQATRPVSS